MILATVLDMRMCPFCPHCSDTDTPCQDTLGSVAELLGGCAGRCDGLIGAVECQKVNGSLHFHWFLFIQRLHQYCTMQEIAERLREALVQSVELKQFLENLCVSTYSNKMAASCMHIISMFAMASCVVHADARKPVPGKVYRSHFNHTLDC